MNDRLVNAVREVVALLAAKDYEGIAFLTQGHRLSASEMETAVAHYGRTLQPLPPEGVDLISFTRVRSVTPPQWAVVVPLWTSEEGRSDLSLELTIVEEATWTTIEVDDIRVL